MNKKFLYITIMTSLLIVTSCQKFIEIPQRGQQNLDNYFSTKAECETFTNGIYKTFTHWDEWWQQYQRLTNEMSTDDAWMGNLNQSSSNSYACAHYLITPSNAPGELNTFYSQKYLNIGQCNIAIERIGQSTIDNASKKQYIGEAKFFRAFDYWELVQNWGDVVLITKMQGTGNLNLAKSPKADVYKQIITDLKEAADSLPNTYTDTKNLGRVTKGACYALLARTYLFMKDYQNAYNYANMVITSGKYSLEPKFVNIWSVYNHNGVESIFEISANPDQAFSIGNRFSIIMNARGEIWPDTQSTAVMDGWGWCVPSSHLEQAFLSENDSIRRKSTIITLGEAVYGDAIDNPKYMFDKTLNKSDRIWRKFYVPIAVRKTLIQKDSHIPLPMVLLRLGEMYLTRAEAAYFLTNPTQALSDINTLRARVKLNGKTGLAGNDLLYAVWKERRLEMASEGIRLYDLRREIDPVANKPMIDMAMGANGYFVKYNTQQSTDPYETIHPEERQDKGILFIAGRHELWPIPQSEIDRSNGVIKQNPGY